MAVGEAGERTTPLKVWALVPKSKLWAAEAVVVLNRAKPAALVAPAAVAVTE